MIGTLSCFGKTQQLEYYLLEERCHAEQVKVYLEGLVQQAKHLGKEMVVVLDNAGFHHAKLIKAEQETWAAKGLRLWFQPPYSPQFNLIETVSKKLKGFLLPRRCYNSRQQLKEAVLVALVLLGAITVSQS